MRIIAYTMGLGKALQAVIVMDMVKTMKRSFSLVFCPATCREQSRSEILNAYQKVPDSIYIQNSVY